MTSEVLTLVVAEELDPMVGMNALAKIDLDDECIRAFTVEVWPSLEYRDSHEDEGPKRLEAYIRKAAARVLPALCAGSRSG
ncbi:hypothetical protein JK364_23260 [Streptomyces sp. 110]|uniref:Uncharacterized protein n=1 Tax=Streptomyces endocoffeicus TaxID=2898945 RepID=A0ABS1PS87_9ACTN|nr:hypothetical protein [Streptomyces endocoffeicus]MBL1115293.1 hypothetical protein [Streptomyces endocoffeicus]